MQLPLIILSEPIYFNRETGIIDTEIITVNAAVVVVLHLDCAALCCVVLLGSSLSNASPDVVWTVVFCCFLMCYAVLPFHSRDRNRSFVLIVKRSDCI